MSNLEGEIKYVETLEAQCTKQICILKSIRKRDRELQKEIRSRKATLNKPLEDPDGYESDGDFEAGRNCSGTADFPLDIDNARPPPASARITAGPGGKAITAPGNGASGFMDPGPEDTQANEMYKEL